jgi:uncharacterized OB-fold protein
MEYKLTFKEYSEALKENRLLGLKCRQCATICVPPRMVCCKCLSPDMDIIELSGRATIQTLTTVFVPAEGREDEAPYTIVLAELEEGPWLMGNLAGVEPEKATMELIGRRLKLGNKVFPGDKYSAGEGARPVFYLAD